MIYFQDYVVIEAGDTPLLERQLLTEDEFRQARAKVWQSELPTPVWGRSLFVKILRRLDHGRAV